MNKKRRLFLAAFYNLIVTIGTILCTFYSFFFGTFGNMTGALNYEIFNYFTLDSNLLSALACLFMAINEIMILKGKRDKINRFFFILKYISTVSVMLTFLTVVFFLSIVYGFIAMFVSSNLFFHLVNPILCLITFLFFEKEEKIGKFSLTFLGTIPMVIYGIVYYLNVIVFKTWNDFYMFTENNMIVFFMIMMPTFTYLISLVIYLIEKKTKRKECL